MEDGKVKNGLRNNEVKYQRRNYQDGQSVMYM